MGTDLTNMKLLLSVVWVCVLGAVAEDTLWWKTAIFYQVYPRSFKDSDGDGIGDLKGIAQMADYFKDIGVDAIWLSPIYKSPMADFGYDVSDYTAIEPMFGTMDDFEALVKRCRAIDLKLVMDFVPNHSSDEHVWFQKSLNREPGYEDFYVWKDPKGYDANHTPIVPNNWLSLIEGNTWTYREERQQFYLHNFMVKQPDLNYRNPYVLSNMTAVLNFWLDKGIDGFRFDAVQQMYEDLSYQDDPQIPGTTGDNYHDYDHIYTANLPETINQLKSWAEMLYQRVQSDGRPRAAFLEIYDTLSITMEYCYTGNASLAFPFNFFLLTNATSSSRPQDLKYIIDDWMNAMPETAVPNWVVGNHDNGRVADRYGHEMVDAINILTGILPGIKVVYYGEEIGMQDTFVRWDETVDPQGIMKGPDHYLERSRDPNRTPLQWDRTTSSGFSSNDTTWLPVNPNYWWLNVAAQKAAETSHLKVFQKIAQARKDPVLLHGDLTTSVPNPDTLLVVRNYNGTKMVLIINMGSEVLDYTSHEISDLASDVAVVLSSINSGYKDGTILKKDSLKVTLRPKAAILLKTVTATPSSGAQLISSFFLIFSALLALLRR